MAFDLPTSEERGELQGLLYKNGLAILGCGTHSIRFRPALNITTEEVKHGLDVIHKTLLQMSAEQKEEIHVS